MNLKEIAALAGVSQATVSFVLNDKPGVNAVTRSRISILLEQNGYEVHRNISSATAKKNITFARFRGSGHLFEAVDDFFSKVFDGVDYALKQLNYNLTVTNVTHADLPSFLSATTAATTDGILFFASEFDPNDADILMQAKVPIVVLDSRITNYPLNTVTVENQCGVYQALKYLWDLGHRDIGYLSSDELTGAIPERHAAFLSMTNKLHLDVNESRIITLPIFVNSCYQHCLQYFRQTDDLPTAFFADNDIIAAGALKACSDLGIRIPADLSIIGFDDSLVCTLFSPALTTMRIPKHELGEMAVQRLQQMIAGDKSVTVSMLVASLIIRETTSAPRRHSLLHTKKNPL